MGPIPFAFSVSHFINSVGADAGFASMIGLSILILLYFAQARETASLREQAREATQRVQQLEHRMAQSDGEPASAAVAAPAALAPSSRSSAATAVPAAERSPAAASVPSEPVAPAGVGAPAPTAATRQIPHAGEEAAAPAAAVAVTERPVENTSVVAPPPATVAGGANGTRRPSPRVVAPLPSSPRAEVHPGGPSATGTGRARPQPIPPASAPRPAPSRTRRALTVGLAVLTAGAIVAGLLVLTSGGSGQNTTATSTPAPASNAPVPPSQRRAGRGAPAPASITVAVLNGTATSGLAHRVAVKLGVTGFKQSTVATASDQTRTATIVGYLAGHRRDALVVASALKLGPPSVSPVDQNSRAVACPPPGGCTAGVVVTVGSDLANRP